MKHKLVRFYQGHKGQVRHASLQRQLTTRVLRGVPAGEKIVIWSVIPDITGGEFCPFEDNKRPPYGNGALDRVVIIHGADVTAEPHAMMAEATRMIRDHGLIDVIGWVKPTYDHALPIWARERRRIALRLCDPWSLKWRRYEKVQDLLTLSFDAGVVTRKDRAVAATPAATRNAS